VYGIIQQHGGCIDVISDPLKGTMFTVYLPLRAEEEPLMEAVHDIPPRTGSETILVAEDDPQVRMLTATTLADFGYTVITAEDGQDAVEQFMAHGDRIHLLVLDIIMPRKNGMKAYEEIRALQPGIAALFTSGYTAEFIEYHGDLAEGTELLMKPVNPLDLARKVREILDRV
jgi:polar amino acid transport system substrate-binding protein